MARRRGRPRKLRFDRFPEFFKVYLPDRSAQQLCLPPAFIKHFNGTIPSKAILKDLCGRVWPVDMEAVESRLFFKNGWQTFVSDHSLVLGEFLVFKYNGESLFDVTVYGTNACKKEQIVALEKPVINVKKEEETESEHTSTPQSPFCKRKCTEIVHRSSGKSRGSNFVSRPKSQGIVSESAEDCDRFDEMKLVLPNSSQFTGSVSLHSPYSLDIPRSWVKKNDIKMKPEMVLRDQSGKSWRVKVSFRKDGRVAITSGWKTFWKDNRMGLNDECTFKFAVGRERRSSKEVQVQITRATKSKRSGHEIDA